VAGSTLGGTLCRASPDVGAFFGLIIVRINFHLKGLFDLQDTVSTDFEASCESYRISNHGRQTKGGPPAWGLGGG
jgi:hypothetical protein